jgi:hypothetical protein
VLALDPAAVAAGNADASDLAFYLSATALNGTWLGLQPLATQLSAYCPPGGFKARGGRATPWLR